MGFSIRLGPIYLCFFSEALFPSQIEEILPIINGFFSSKKTGSNHLASKVEHPFCCCQTALISSFQHAAPRRPGHHGKRGFVAWQQLVSSRKAKLFAENTAKACFILFFSSFCAIAKGETPGNALRRLSYHRNKKVKCLKPDCRKQHHSSCFVDLWAVTFS